MARFFLASSAEVYAQAMGMGMDEFYSIEAGAVDGMRHFDHHRLEHRANPAPCRDERIPTVGTDDIVVLTHMDADSYVGILRIMGAGTTLGLLRGGYDLPKADFALMERIDLNGSSVVGNLFDPTLLYMVGVEEVARKLKFPRASAEEPIEITELVEHLLYQDPDDFIAAGRAATERSEDSYRRCLAEGSWGEPASVGLWVVGPDDPFDPSRPYRDGIEVVVVYRRHYESVSIYCSPDSESAFAGQELAGIQFSGHPKACGSPRGTAFTEADAHRVFEAVCAAR